MGNLSIKKSGAAVIERAKSQLSRQPEKKELALAQRAKRGLIWFFAVMLALTFISRAANEALIARVTVSGVSGGVIDKSVQGAGTWAAVDEKQQRAEFSGLRIGEIFVRPGETIALGAQLYSYEKASVEAKLDEHSIKLEQFKLQIEQLKTGMGDSAKSAELALSQAENDLLLAQQKLETGKAQIAESKRMAYEDALYAYRAQENLYQSQIIAAQQLVDEAKAKLNPLEIETQQALNDATAALDALNAQWEFTLAEPARKLQLSQNDWSSVQYGTYNYANELASYNDAVANAEKMLETAKFNYKQAKQNDGDLNNSIAYQSDSIALNMAAEQQACDALNALLGANCVVCADMAGTVTAVNCPAGALTTGEAVVTFSTKGLALTAKVSAEAAAELSVGDGVTLISEGKPSREKLAIKEIGLAGADGLCQIICADDSGKARSLGGTQEFIIEKNSDKQNTRIPLSALREDGGAYYVLILGEKDTVLGKQQIAVRVDVKLIFHDEERASVDGGISGDAKLITSSNKPVAAGDRVVVRDA